MKAANDHGRARAWRAEGIQMRERAPGRRATVTFADGTDIAVDAWWGDRFRSPIIGRSAVSMRPGVKHRAA